MDLDENALSPQSVHETLQQSCRFVKDWTQPSHFGQEHILGKEFKSMRIQTAPFDKYYRGLDNYMEDLVVLEIMQTINQSIYRADLRNRPSSVKKGPIINR